MLDRLPPLALVVGLAGCGIVAPDAPLPSDTGTEPVDTAMAPDDVAVDVRDPMGPCDPINASSRSAFVLKGPLVFDKPGPRDSTTSAILLFPEGRVAGAKVHLVMRLLPGPGFASGSGVLDASLGATGLRAADPHCANVLDGTLLGPTDGVRARVTVNASTSDELKPYSGDAKLCVLSTLTTGPEFSGTASAWPLDTPRFSLELPFDPATLDAATVTTGGAKVETKATLVDGMLQLTASSAFPPSAGTVDVDLGGVRDLLGRSVPKPTRVAITVPTGAVLDRTFSTPPPDNAFVLGDGAPLPRTSSGETRFSSGGDFSPNGVLLALGREPSARSIRLRHRLACVDGFDAPKVTLVSTDGKKRALAVGCSDTTMEETVPLPGTQPTYLVVTGQGRPAVPCAPPSLGNAGDYVIDDLQFVP